MRDSNKDLGSKVFLQVKGPRLRFREWGGWGSNPRPADYEKYGRMHRAF
jgi:hypothetical protein